MIRAAETQETDHVEAPSDDAERLGKEEQKRRFVELRAKGYSYARIAKELRVSKGTLTAWNIELEAEIAKVRTVEPHRAPEQF